MCCQYLFLAVLIESVIYFSTKNLTIVTFTSYLLMVVGVALLAYHVTRNLSDFVLGGRQLGGPVAALSAGASDMSAWLLLGLPGAVFTSGLTQIWLPIGLFLGAFLSWKCLAKPLRVFSETAQDALTLPAFLDNRFLKQSRSIRVLLALFTLIFFSVYIAAGLVASALLLQQFHFSYIEALLLGTSIIVLYTLVGGFLAVSWTDFFQGTLMLGFLLGIPLIATHSLGGWQELTTLLKTSHKEALNPFHQYSGLLFLNLMAWGLGYLGQPHILVRFMAVRTLRDIPVAKNICLIWMSLSLLGAVCTGLVGMAYYPSTIHPESVFIMFSQELFAPWLGGIILAAILSSSMCAIDSQMLAASSALTEDIYHRIFRKNATQKELIWVGRFSIAIIACLSLVLARHPNSTVTHLVAFAWAGLGASFGPSLVAALFWRRMTAQGALWGILAGALTVILWQICEDKGGIFQIYGILPGFLFGGIGVVLGSLCDRLPHPHITAQFDTVKALLKEYPMPSQTVALKKPSPLYRKSDT